MRRSLAVAAYVIALLAWCWLVGIPNDPIGVALWMWALAIAWRGDWAWQFPRDWWPWLLALAVYGVARGLTDDLGFAPHVTAPIRADEWLARLWGATTVPTVSLQRELLGEPIRWYDYLASATYASHFVVGLALAGVLWLRERALWLSWIRRYVVISYLALAGYIVYPMAPPWLAGRDGLLPYVARVSSRASQHLGVERTTMVFGGLPNQTAAMPSLHTGFACLVAFYAISRLTAWWRWLLLLYPVCMAWTLIYAGEHYLVDTLAGAGVAGLAMAIGAWWDRWRPPEEAAGRSPSDLLSQRG